MTTTPTTVEEIAQALRDNDAAPYGPARALRAGQLAELAEQTGNVPLLIWALQELITAREFGGHNDEILVPFARVLAMWDERPEDFDRWAAHRLHWHFKWVSTSVLTHPNIPLSAIERWRDQMADRYRRAGHGMRAVYSCRHDLAAHVGDDEAAQHWYDEWLSVDRDEMADCHACERSGQGDWQLHLGHDAAALDAWAPVLGGQLTCAEEPHRVLGRSLLPLVRLGRLTQARDNHLRGYRMARGNDNLRSTVGEHIEFAALTGNETRGLEMLSEHAGWLGPDEATPATRQKFLEGVAILLGRLAELGHPDTPVPTPRGAAPTTPVGELLPAVRAELADITGRFDRRNGTSAVGDRSRTRLAQRPLVDALSLGVRAAPLTRPAPVTPAPAPAPRSLDELIAAARELEERRHPHAYAAWERVAATGEPLAAEVVARVAQSRALAVRGDAARSRALFQEASRRYAEAGLPGHAAANQARAGLAAVLAGEAEPGWADLDAARGTGLDDREAVIVGLCRARAAWWQWVSAPEPTGPVPARVREETAAAQVVVDRLGQPYQSASLDVLRGQTAWAAGDPDGATVLFRQAIDGYLRAEAPWEAALPRSILAEIALSQGDAATAAEQSRTALDEGAALLHSDVRAGLARTYAHAAARLGDRDPDVVDHALAAAHHFDATAPVPAAHMRVLAAEAFHRMRRYNEAVALLETVVPDLPTDESVNARRLAGQCLTELGDHPAAARELLAAAEIARHWPDQTGHATLAHEAATALQQAGKPQEAERAFARAAQLWRELGELSSGIRATRAQAWSLADREPPDFSAALALFDGAGAELAAADPTEPRERWERPETQRQAAHLIIRWHDDIGAPAELVPRGLALARESVDGFRALGDARSAVRSGLLAAEFEMALDRREEAVARVRALRDECEERGDTALVERCDQYLTWLNR